MRITIKDKTQNREINILTINDNMSGKEIIKYILDPDLLDRKDNIPLDMQNAIRNLFNKDSMFEVI